MNFKILLLALIFIGTRTIINAHTGDSIPPVINSLTITPSTINNGDTITVLINTTDDVSGIERIQVDIKNPNVEQDHTAFGQISNYGWEDLGNGDYQFKVGITEWAISGEWYVSDIYVHDIAGNYVSTSSSDSIIATFIVNGVNAIDEVSNALDIIVFPNPSNGIINISGKEEILTLSIFDLNSKIVFKSRNEREIDLTGLPSNIYIIKIETLKGMLIDKIILK